MMTNIKLLFKSLCIFGMVVFCSAAALILRGDADALFWKAVHGVRAFVAWILGLAATALCSGSLGFLLGACFRCGKDK